MAKYTVSYSRTVQVKPYENLKIGLSEEYDTDEVPREWAFNKTREKVEEQIQASLKYLGIPGR